MHFNLIILSLPLEWNEMVSTYAMASDNLVSFQIEAVEAAKNGVGRKHTQVLGKPSHS